MTDEKETRARKLLRRLQEQGEFTPEPPKKEEETPQGDEDEGDHKTPEVNPFIVEDVGEITLPEDVPDLAERSNEEAAAYLARLELKMQTITEDYGAGRINQAQFQAVYTRYREQREIVTRLLARNPDSEAWQKVANEGYTEFLHQQHQAKVLGVVVLNNHTGGLIKRLGEFTVSTELLLGMLETLGTGPLNDVITTQVEDGRWLSLIQGKAASSVVLYSREPPTATQEVVKRAHREFERVNEAALRRPLALDPKLLRYPQQALLPKD